MPALAKLHQAVGRALASKRLGRPVFARYFFQADHQLDAFLPCLTVTTATVRDWFGQPLDRIHALGSLESGQVSLTLQFRDGATAFVNFARGQPRGLGVDLLVLGNHGAIYHDAHDAGNANLWDDSLETPPGQPEPQLQALIERALHSGQPEKVRGGHP